MPWGDGVVRPPSPITVINDSRPIESNISTLWQLSTIHSHINLFCFKKKSLSISIHFHDLVNKILREKLLVHFRFKLLRTRKRNVPIYWRELATYLKMFHHRGTCPIYIKKPIYSFLKINHLSFSFFWFSAAETIGEKNWVFTTNLVFVKPISLQPYDVNLWYFKLTLFDLS